MEIDNQTFIPGRHKLDPGQVLSPDFSTYKLLHTLESPWPCLSFDILRDQLGTGKARKEYPATVYAVAGTQAAQGHDKENEILVMKMSKLAKMDRPEEEDSSDDEDDDDTENADPILETKSIRTGTCTNRIRAWQAPQQDVGVLPTTLAAAMTESGNVLIHDVTPHLTSFDTPGYILNATHSTPLHKIISHKSTEGYALDWSPSSPTPSTTTPKLLTGDTSGNIYAHTLTPSSTLTTDPRPYTGHTGSIEELHWSPSESNVFASASSDGTVQIWDLRSKSHKPALGVQVSAVDVNVLAWNKHQEYLLATGADDGVWAVWDLRSWKGGDAASSNTAATKPAHTPVASFAFHKQQITSLEWHPTDDSVMLVAAADDTVTLWDASVEHDDEESRFTADARDVPPQLLFVHYAQEVKECHWHPQAAGQVMCTGGSGFGVFRTISV